MKQPSRQRLMAELGIVVLGILIALGVDRLNEHRLDRIRESRYLEQLVSDLALDTLNLQRSISGAIGHRESALRVLEVIRGGSPATDPGALAWHINYAGYINFFYPSDATYRDLVSTGNLDLVRDVDLRASIVTYYEDVELSTQFYDVWKGYAWGQLNPTLQQLLHPDDWTVIESSQRDSDSLLPEAGGNAEIRIGRVLGRLRASEPVQNMFTSVAVGSTEQQGEFTRRLDEARELLSRISDAQ